MLMTYTGRRSGKYHTLPVNYLQIGADLYTISSRDRVWWRNLRSGAPVTLRFQGQDISTQAEVHEADTEVANYLIHYLETAPHLGRYLRVQRSRGERFAPEAIARLAKQKVMVRTRLK
jgi:hypothetical protein